MCYWHLAVIISPLFEVFLTTIIYKFASLWWFTTFNYSRHFCPERLQMLLRVTPIIQNIRQFQHLSSMSLDRYRGAHITIYVPAVNIELSAIKHTLVEKC